MKSSRIVSFFAALVVLLSATGFAQAESKDYVAGELLVKYKDGTASAAAFETAANIGASVVEQFPDLGWQRVKLPNGMTTEQGLAQFQNFSAVETVQPNFYYHLLATPNDSQYASAGMYGLGKISAPAAWDVTTGSPNIVVADIDTGMRYTHEDLAANAWLNTGEIAGNGVDDDANGFVDDVRGWDFFYNDSNPIDDAGGHGTHTAGTIGAVGNNSKGVVGVNWNVKIMPIKIYSPNGTDSTSAMLVNAYNYVRMMKTRGVNIRVTNNSYGGCGEACGYDQATKDALDAMGEAGVLNVFAAGNDNRNIETTPSFPASYTSPSVLAVASSTSTDARSGFSNFGAVSVDLAAPGSGVLSTYNTSDAGYATLSGTSMATPHVAGAAALLSAANPNLSAASLKATLMNTVDPIAAFSGLVKTGGRLNVARAIQNQTVCTFNLSSSGQFIDIFGGSGSFTVTAPTNCDYSIISQVSWITVTTANTGSGNSTVSFTVAANNGLSRSGVIRVAGLNFTVNQNGGDPGPPSNVLDFDGDGRTDYAAIQEINGSAVWHVRTISGNYTARNFGFFTDKFVPSDFDGDGKADLAVWRGGANAGDAASFYVLRSATNTFQAVQWGVFGDLPLMARDFDGDFKADFAVTRKIGGSLYWYILQSTAGYRAVQFGLDTDIPIRGDFDGDFRADVAVYRPASSNPANTFFILKSSGGFQATTFGDSSTDRVVSGDFDGDAKTDIAVWRATNGAWYWLQSSNGGFRASQFGQTGDVPTTGDYDGDGRTDLSVWRPNNSPNESGIFYINRSSSGFTSFAWGQSQMIIPAALQNGF